MSILSSIGDSIRQFAPVTGRILGTARIHTVDTGGGLYARAQKVVTTTNLQTITFKALRGYGTDFFKGWYIIGQNCTNVVRGEWNVVTASVNATGKLSFIANGLGADVDITGASDWSGNPVKNDVYRLVPPEHFSLEPTNYIRNAIEYDAANTGAAATRELFTVTGGIRFRMLPVCERTCTSGGTPSLSFGPSTDTDLFIPDTDITDLAAGELWFDATPTESARITSDAMIDGVSVNGVDLGTDNSGGGTITEGIIAYNLWWVGLSPGSNVVAAAGTSTL